MWRETFALSTACALLILVMTRPAFGAFFIGENFEYLGQYRASGDSLIRAAFSTITGTFFRPVLCWASLPWHWLLPPEPFAYHLRNFGFSILNIVLLHRVLIRLAPSATARAISMLLFAGSKVHMTTIGYINIFDSIVVLMLLLLSVLFCLRYLNSGRPLELGLSLASATLAMFSKDYGLMVVPLIIALVASPRAGGLRLNLFRVIAPLLALTAAYITVRYWIAGLPPDDNPVYAPGFSVYATLRKLLMLGSGIWNLSFINKGAAGESGLWSWFLQGATGIDVRAALLDAVSFVVLTTLLVCTLAAGRRAGAALAFPALMACYFVPTLLVRNEQIYYYYESFAGIALLVGTCLSQAGKRLVCLWAVALVVVVAQGAFSNYRSLYFWHETANKVERILDPVIEAHRGGTVESIHFITSSVTFWRWALVAHSHGPLVGELLGLPRLRVTVMSADELKGAGIKADSSNLIFDVDGGMKELRPD